jgi:hypothetical protein
MALKVFSTRILCDTDNIDNTDTYYKMEAIRDGLTGKKRTPGLGGISGAGYITFHLDGKYLKVSENLEGKKIGIAFTGISSDLEGFPYITRKQANAIACVCARVLCIKGATRGDKALASMVEFYSNTSGRLIQAASIPEDFSDNEFDQVLNAKVTFNKKTYKRPTKYSR